MAEKNLMDPWKPGQSGNPAGRKALTETERSAREFISRHSSGLWIDLLMTPVEVLEKKRDIEGISAGEKWLIESILKGIRDGDLNEYLRMAAQITGRPRMAAQITAPSGSVELSIEWKGA